jgi:5'(3')-deoxyribonucleotidase
MTRKIKAKLFKDTQSRYEITPRIKKQKHLLHIAKHSCELTEDILKYPNPFRHQDVFPHDHPLEKPMEKYQ